MDTANHVVLFHAVMIFVSVYTKKHILDELGIQFAKQLE
jgi:hypothetical protein